MEWIIRSFGAAKVKKHLSIAVMMTMLIACNQYQEGQPLWQIDGQGIIFNGQLQTSRTAAKIACSQCQVSQHNEIRPSGPASYTLIKENDDLKAIWGKSHHAALYIPNSGDRPLINLAADTEAGVWLMDIDSTPKPLKVGKVNYVMLGKKTYQVVIAANSQHNDFEYSVLVK